MPPLPSPARRPAILALAALLIGPWLAAAQDEPDPKAVAAKATAAIAKIREKLAADPAGARFRVDGFAADGNAVKIKGVVLAPGKDAADRQAGTQAAVKKVEALVAEVTGAKQVAFNTDDVQRVDGDDLPNVFLQKEAAKAGGPADALKLDDARFDKAGRLVLVGTRGKSAGTEKWLTARAKAMLEARPALAGKDADAAAKAAVAGVAAKDWPLAPAGLQAELHKAGLRRFRIDRVACSAEPAAVAEANPAGLAWTFTVSGVTLGTDRPDDQELKGIEGVVMRAATDLGVAKTATLTIGLTADDYRVTDPAVALQKAVAATRALDGLRVDPGSQFGPAGELVLAGLTPGLTSDATTALGEAYKKAVAGLKAKEENPARAAAYETLAAAPLSTAGMVPVDTRKLLADLRQWVTDNKDDVRLSRLYFDQDRGLKLVVAAPREEDFAAVRTVLRKMAGDYPALVDKKAPANSDSPPKGGAKPDARGKQSALPRLPLTVPVGAQPKDEPKEAAGTGPDVVRETGDRPFPALTPELRKRMAADPKAWRGVLIERGYFDKDNRFTLRGVVDDKGQNADLAKLLASLKADPTWATYFATPPAPPDLTVIPMAELEDRVRRVAPAYEEFDGIRVTRANYDADANLVFTALVVGRPNPKAAARLKELIAADKAGFGRRLPGDKAVKIERSEQAPPDAQLAAVSAGSAAAALAKKDLPKAREWLDVGLLHYPDDTALWFLSAYHHHVTGDKELTRRDLHRIAELEGRLDLNSPGRKRRYEAARDLQGEKRDELEKLAVEVWKEAKTGAKPITIARPK